MDEAEAGSARGGTGVRRGRRTCGPISSSPIAAATCSSRTSASPIPPCGKFIPSSRTNVTVRGVAISSHGPNNDGCDPECCRDVLIENCLFDTGDDCIAIKSGKNADGRRVNVAFAKHHRARLRDEGRPRRRGGGQRSFRERAAIFSPRIAKWTART